MHFISRPTLSAEAIFAAAVPTIYGRAKQARFAAEINQISVLGAAYESAAADGQTWKLSSSAYTLATVTDKEMSNFYSYRLRSKEAPNRFFYDRILAIPRHGRCPYCGERRVKTLDHYLPQSSFSALAVTATNLVPSCSDCNKSKNNYEPSGTKPPLLHPYFDNLDTIPWLRAGVIPGDPPGITYWVDHPSFESRSDAVRVQNHFEVFELFELFVSHAAQTLDELNMRLPDLHMSGGAAAVRQYLLEEITYLVPRPMNLWRRPLYGALAASRWYCDVYAGGL